MHNIHGLVHRPILFTVLLFMLGSVNTAMVLKEDSSQPPVDFSDAILSSTVQIRIYDPENTYFSYGLGSLFVFQGKEYILTHSHWPSLFLDSKVQFYDQDGLMTVEMTGQEFLDLVQYQDSGSLIVVTSQKLCCPALLAETDSALYRSEQVSVAHYAFSGHGQIKISIAQVLQVDESGIPVFAITMLGEDESNVGDSGAGIWYEGRLVANLWSVIVENPPVDQWEGMQVIYAARFPDEFYKQNVTGLDPVGYPKPFK